MRVGSIDLRASDVADRYRYPLPPRRLDSACHKSHETHICSILGHNAPPLSKYRNLKVNTRLLCTLTGDIWGDRDPNTAPPLVNSTMHVHADESLDDTDGAESTNSGYTDTYQHDAFMDSIRLCIRNEAGGGRWKKRAPKKPVTRGRERRGGMEIPGMIESPKHESSPEQEKPGTGGGTTKLPPLSKSKPLSQPQSSRPRTTEIPRGTSALTMSQRTHRAMSFNPHSGFMAFPTVDEIVRILQRPQAARAYIEDRRLFMGLRRLPAFSKLSDFTVAQLMGVIHLNEFEKDRTVFKQGDVATSWYVILRGRVDVLALDHTKARMSVVAPPPPMMFAPPAAGAASLAPPGSLAPPTGGALPEMEPEHKVVVSLTAGDHFGDLALSNNAPRNATIKTTEPTLLMRIEKEEYLRVVRFIHEKERQEKILFLKRCPPLTKSEGLSLIADVMNIKPHTKGTKVLIQGHIQNELCFIKSGVCGVYVHLEITGDSYDKPDDMDASGSFSSITGALTLPNGGRCTVKKLELELGSPSAAGNQAIVGPCCYQFFLGYLRAGDYFGEKILRYEDADSKETPVVSPMTIKCLGDVELGHIQLHDARARLQEDQLPLGHLTAIASDRAAVLAQHAALVDMKRWNKFKKASMDKLVREMLKDPNVDLQQFVERRVVVKG
ncbi:Cyclic nucleotide-binding domain-containing protein 2 [Geranomyces variabilis]|nr:Cyclic nucleotide-binding domain-containing protein 2 [Geranomyces variabilis]